MERKDVIALLEETLEVEEGSLCEDSSLDDIDEWDSLAKLSLMALAKKEFSKILTATQIREFVTVKDICDALV
jgi:acyl carrier protein